MKVWKFGVSHKTELPLNAESKCVLFGFDGEKVRCAWFTIDETKPFIARSFRIAGTGTNVERCQWHIASCIDPDGHVWHLFEVQP